MCSSLPLPVCAAGLCWAAPTGGGVLVRRQARPCGHRRGWCEARQGDTGDGGPWRGAGASQI
jgi:hypothetical protein